MMKRQMSLLVLGLFTLGWMSSCAMNRKKPNDISQQFIESEQRLKRGQAQLQGTDAEELSRYDRMKIREREAVRNWWWRYKSGTTF